MNTANKGLPAFPVGLESGLSKREYIATKAMQGFLADSEFSPLLTDEDMEEDANGQYRKNGEFWVQYSSGNTHKIVTTFEQRVAKVSVKYADALLAELEK